MKRAAIVAALVVGCTQPSGGNGASGVDVKYGASLEVKAAQQTTSGGGVGVAALVVVGNRGQIPLSLNVSRFSVEMANGLAYSAEWISSCPGDELVSGHSAECQLLFKAPPPGGVAAILYKLPDDRVLRASAVTQPCATCDDGQCHNLLTEIDHCGACGVRANVCESGVPRCSPGVTLCSDGCRATSYDLANCGSCGHACDSGQACQSGQCQVVCSLMARDACLSCCQSQHPAGSASFQMYYQSCLCGSSGLCASDCQSDYCATGVVSDFICQFCAEQSGCDVTTACLDDAGCSAYLDCTERCWGS